VGGGLAIGQSDLRNAYEVTERPVDGGLEPVHIRHFTAAQLPAVPESLWAKELISSLGWLNHLIWLRKRSGCSLDAGGSSTGAAAQPPSAGLKAEIPSVDWWITNHCDLACDFCYKPVSGEDPVERRPEILKALAASSARVVTFCGGEPLLIQKVDEYAAALAELGTSTVLNTNGELLRKRLDQGLRLAGFTMVGISIEGSTQAVHRAMRGAKADLDEVMEAARLVTREPGVSLKLATVVSRVNRDDLPALAETVRGLAPDIWRLYQYSSRGDQNSGQQRHRLLDEEFWQLVKTVTDLAAPVVPTAPSSEAETEGCLIVDPAGNVLQPVGGQYVRRGNCLEEPLDQIWAGIPVLAEVFGHAAVLDLDSYARAFAESSSSLEEALSTGRLPCHPALVERSRDLARLVMCLWRVTSPDSPLHRRLIQTGASSREARREPEKTAAVQQAPEQPSATRRPRAHPQTEGARLEAGMLGIFERLFRVGDDDARGFRGELRRQRSGTQFGADIVFRATAVNSSSTCLVECKNHAASSSGLPVSVVADKVLQAEASFDAEPVDHWILVSPELDPNNELDRLVHRWNSTQKFPFTVQIWSPQSGIRDLFAIEPAIYRELYGEDPPLSRPDPGDVLAAFSERLRPPVRLPGRLAAYLKDPVRFVEPKERAWLDQLESQIVRFGFDENGARLACPLEAEIISVLFDSPTGSNVALLLAEFGEGKSFFTVSLCCHLRARYLSEPRAKSPIPIRLFLRGYRHVSAPVDFLRTQLELIGLGMDEWSELRRQNVLVVLDGLDEMSVRQDPATTRSNLDKIGSLLELFEGLPVLITSRPHFFSSGPDRERFYDLLRKPHVFRMRQPDRRDTVAHLRAYADSLDLAPKLNKIKELYDPIGLAGKVLFLEMIKTTLDELPEDRFDELVLYETYVRGSLRRKVELLRDPGSAMSEAKLLVQVEELLEMIAVAIHVSGEGSVDLQTFAADYGGAARLLWQATKADAPQADDEDAGARIGGRSLLRRLDPDGDDGWAVDFFHRSMKEYFVAKALRRALDAPDPFAATRALLIKTPVQPEILGFFKLLADGNEGAATVLASLAHSARVGSGQEILGGGAFSLYRAIGGRTKGCDWRSLQLDGAILAGADLSGSDFRGSTLRGGDLSSADLTGTDLRWADLTDANLDAGDNIVAFSADLAPHCFACLTQGSRLGRIMVRADGSLRSSFVPLPRPLQGPGNLHILAEDIVLIGTNSEFLIVETGSGAAEEVTHFRISGDLRDVAVVDRSFLGLRIDPGWENGAALLVDIESGEIDWRIPSASGEDIWGWFREGIVTAYGSDVSVCTPDADMRVMEAEFRFAGRNLSVCGDTVTGVTEDGRVAWIPMADPRGAQSIPVHSGAGTAVIAADRGVLSAGSDGSVALTRPDGVGNPIVAARLERRLQCSGALVEGLKGDCELSIFLANGAHAPGATPA
jgi:pyruvate-formate lyase-activating enzyme